MHFNDSEIWWCWLSVDSCQIRDEFIHIQYVLMYFWMFCHNHFIHSIVMAHCQTRWANRACLLEEIGSVLYAFLSNWNLLHTISFSEEIIMLSIQVSIFIFNLICMNRGQGQGLGSCYNIFQCSDPSAWPWAKVWAVGLLEIAKLETAAFWIAMVKQWWKHLYQCGWMWFHWFCTLYKTCGFTFNHTGQWPVNSQQQAISVWPMEWAFALQKLDRI